MPAYASRKITDVIARVVPSKRCSKNSGTVVMPDRRYRGSTSSAIRTSDAPAKTSHAITHRPSLKASPFSPTSCSVDRFVSISEPAMYPPVSDRPPRK